MTVPQLVGMLIAGLSGLAIAAIGAIYLVAPRRAATGFGLPSLPQESATPWLQLKGLRDLATGVVAGVLLLTAPIPTLGWALLAFTLIPAGDALVVLRSGGRRGMAWGVHGGTASLMAVGAVLLLSG